MHKTSYEMRISDWSSDVCSSDLCIKAPMVGKKAENKAVGMSRGGRNTKIHTLVDGLGNPLAFLLSSGNEHDSTHAVPLLQEIDIKGKDRKSVCRERVSQYV